MENDLNSYIHYATPIFQLRTARDHQVFELEYRMRNTDGEWRWLNSQAVVFHRSPNGTPDQILGMAQSIAYPKQVVQEREQRLAKAEAARIEAETANRRKDEFLAVVSHELRSPLNSILGWAKLLQARTYDTTVTNRALATIERNALSQSHLIEDLLDLSRMIRGDLRISLAPVNLVEIVESAIANIQIAAEAKAISVRSQIERSIGTTTGDPQRLQQVLTNLLTNAVKFTPNGGKVYVSLGTAADDSAIVEMIVRDTGKGIDAEFLPHIFNRFTQASGDLARTKDGLGLGLAIVRHLVELHNGTICAESAGANQGATFTVRLPLIQS
ncbi:MAG TPA: PAS domain-containing sensor histidine kinase [Leptolyngbya sp.]|jgi:signal transduction histidine kinase|nr:PAS domain-containing sensor histidine kinase [Leptolyngbya sp.]